MRAIAGSILIGFSLLVQILSEWKHKSLVFDIGLNPQQTYPLSHATRIHFGDQLLIYIFMGVGVMILVWGLWETRKKP